jgi:hypothetical protein
MMNENLFEASLNSDWYKKHLSEHSSILKRGAYSVKPFSAMINTCIPGANVKKIYVRNLQKFVIS